MFDVFFGLYNPFPPSPRPEMSFKNVVNVYSGIYLPKGNLEFRGGGGASKNKLKYASFIIPMTNVTTLSIFRTHAQKDYRKTLEMKSTSILNILALLLFEK